MLDALARWLDAMDRAGVQAPPRTLALPMLAERYGRLGMIHADLLRGGAAMSETWRAVVDLADRLAYLGGTHAGGGLRARLHDGSPWRASDVVALRELADTARALAAGSE